LGEEKHIPANQGLLAPSQINGLTAESLFGSTISCSGLKYIVHATPVLKASIATALARFIFKEPELSMLILCGSKEIKRMTGERMGARNYRKIQDIYNPPLLKIMKNKSAFATHFHTENYTITIISID
jgi:hypothetical protein